MAEFDDEPRDRPTPREDVGQLESLDSVLGEDRPGAGRPRGGDRRRRRE
ncbi:MAG: hypothetical protein JNK15_15785 [Planctomycetes bacterium]|nr:hypothetical protein [Planctomycetota bacterium]